MMVLNFGTVPYHLQIPTIGQMGWVLVSKEYSSAQLATSSQIRINLSPPNGGMMKPWR